MMDLRDNSGVLFKARDKQTDRSPDITGEAMVGGVRWRVAAWRHEGKEGKPGFLSLKFAPPNERRRDG